LAATVIGVFDEDDPTPGIALGAAGLGDALGTDVVGPAKGEAFAGCGEACITSLVNSSS